MRMAPRKPVNNRSINLLKKRALRRSKTLHAYGDGEAQTYRAPSKLSQWIEKLKAPFTRIFWQDFMEPTEDETLVDGKVLSYAYLEAGVIEFLGGYARSSFLALSDSLFDNPCL